MIDLGTKQRLYVSDGGDAGPYIMVLVRQLDDVRELLDANTISYWVDEEAISLNGEPEVTVITLGRDTDAESVQKALDAAS